MINNAELRKRLVNQKLDEVEMQKMNKDVNNNIIQTIDVLDDSNKYIKDIQNQLERKDWRNILNEAQRKYEVEWP